MSISGTQKKTPCHRVLVVDDEPHATHVLGKLLRRHGYIAAEDNDPTKAVHIASRFQPDAVLLDVRMAWKDGYEVAADFASDKFLRGVPIIFITGFPAEAAESPMTAPLLVKPFQIEDLLVCLEESIAGNPRRSPAEAAAV